MSRKEDYILNFLEHVREQPAITYTTALKAFDIMRICINLDLYCWCCSIDDQEDDLSIYISQGNRYDYDCHLSVNLGTCDGVKEYIYHSFGDMSDLTTLDYGAVDYSFEEFKIWIDKMLKFKENNL